MCSRWPSPTQKCLNSHGTPRRKIAQSELRALVQPQTPVDRGPPGHESYSHMVLTQGESLPQGEEQAAHKALGGRATWERSWRDSAKQRHIALREEEGESPGTCFQGPGAERRTLGP